MKKNNCSGQSLVEYALITALIAVTVFAVLSSMGKSATAIIDSTKGSFQKVDAAIEQAEKEKAGKNRLTAEAKQNQSGSSQSEVSSSQSVTDNRADNASSTSSSAD